jgi:uncharacterized protein (DUF1800 family)
MAKDPAMLVYLDGITNAVRSPNENFGREVMELFTVGRGNYSQDDVVAASRAFTGWAVNVPGRPNSDRLDTAGIQAWKAGLVANRHDNSAKTLLGVTGNLDMDRALDVLLDHPATAPRIAGKLYTELVGRQPDDATSKRLGKVFRDGNYDVMKLVTAIVADKGFTADAAIRSKVRTPLEKLVALLQAYPETLLTLGPVALRGRTNNARGGVGQALLTMGYVPFAPPNVAGFPKGSSLLGPHQLVHAFDLLSVFAAAPKVPKSAGDVLAKLGLFDVSDRTRSAIDHASDPGTRLALAYGSPEFAAV